MGDNNTQDDQNPGDLRTQLDKANADKGDLASQVAAYQQDEQLREAGFSHLNKVQRNAILRDLRDAGTEFSPEAAKAMAEQHGYPLTATPPPPPAGDTGGQPNGDQPPPDPVVDESLTVQALMDRARSAAAGNAGNTDFEQEMKKANSPDQLRDLIRTKGARHQIVHEWDVP